MRAHWRVQTLSLRGGGGGEGGGFDLLAPLGFLPSAISSFFTQNKGACTITEVNQVTTH